MVDIWQTLIQLFVVLGNLLVEVGRLALNWLLLIVWVAWWLGGVNWKRAWPVLAQGGGIPAVLLVVMGALVWSQISPSECACLGFMTIPNFWWQLLAVSGLAALALFCGWLQGVFGWTPPELNLEPPAVAAHGHDHGHHH